MMYKIKVLASFGFHDFVFKVVLESTTFIFAKQFPKKMAFWGQWTMNKQQIRIKNQDIRQKLKTQKTNKDQKHIFETHQDPK